MNLKIIILFSLTQLLLGCNSKEQNIEVLPNIIHIFADDLGYGDLGCFGAMDIKTPFIDGLAKNGIKFTDFYSASSICSPSRAGLLTGRFPQRMGINEVFFPESFTGMPQSEITIAELLKEKQYKTGIVGKWHLGHHREFLPLQQGFDSYFGIPYSNDMASAVYMIDNEVIDFNVNQKYITKTYTEKALEFIDNNKENPFFLYLSHSMPHVPIYASEEFLGTSERGLYGDVIQELDWSVGQIMDKLKSLHLLENTLIIFSSDNGPWLVMEDHGGSAGKLREGKMYTFEGGMRVPTIAMWKGKIPKGSVYRGLASQMDWLPTICEITGVQLPKDRNIDGKDISKVLFGKGDRDSNVYMYFDHQELQCYRSGNWKVKIPFQGWLGNQYKQPVAAHDTLLFNLKKDPEEQFNLYHEKPNLAKDLLKEMELKYKEMGELPKPLLVRKEADESHFDYLKSKK